MGYIGEPSVTVASAGTKLIRIDRVFTWFYDRLNETHELSQITQDRG